jgi:chorismate synthase
VRGNSFGKMITMTSFGESHGAGLGVVIDGVPGGLTVELDDLKHELKRRAPGNLKGTTTRKEADEPKIYSGIFEGKTLGSPITVVVENTNQRSADYDKLKTEYRPGHADETTMKKYGIRDHRGGGRSSGRETLARVIAGYFASLVIPDIKVRAYINKLADFKAPLASEIDFSSDFGPYSMPGVDAEKIKEYLLDLQKNGQSIGGQVCIVVDNCPAGLGEPAFDKLKADFAKALMSIGAVTSFSYGLGEEMANVLGSEASKDRANFGGIEGGISNGDRITLNIAFKPTSTVGDKAKAGRHDPCIIPRAIPVVEAMVKLVLADHYLRQRAYGDGHE